MVDLICEVDYLPGFLSLEEAQTLFEYLEQFEALTSLATIASPTGQVSLSYGKLSFADADNPHYGGDIHGNHVPWTETMMTIRQRIEGIAGRPFNVCVCIYYPHGQSGVAFHTDLTSFGDTRVVPSLSLGATRQFQLREISTGKITDLTLNSGDLVIMGPGCQERYQHAVPLDPDCKSPRINLTFRPIGF